MILAIPLAWLQLMQDKLRLSIALAGVGFAVILIFMQLGFQEALFSSAVRFHKSFNYDIALISPRTDFIVQPRTFTRRRLFQVLGLKEVDDVYPVYLGQLVWKNPTRPSEGRALYVVGFDPTKPVFSLPEVANQLANLRVPDVALYDRLSRPEFGPVAELFEAAVAKGRGSVVTEIGNRQIEVVGLYDLGTSFGIDASIITSDLNFLRYFPNRPPGLIDLGLVRLTPGADAEAVRDRIEAMLPGDVEVVTRAGFVQREVDYWNKNTPIGYVFSFGVVIGLMVGCIIVYQILFADVSDHLQEYATLKAMGYSNRYLFGLVFQEATYMAVLGFVPGFALCLLLYDAAGTATRLPLVMTAERGVFVFVLTLAMCLISGAIALRKVRSLDPADIF
jgi:putative ABC transport system permease protein